MGFLKTALVVVHLIVTVVLVIVVLLQESKTGGLSGTVTGGDTETFFGKNSGGTYDAMTRRWTAICAGIFLVTSFSLSMLLK